MHKNRSYSQCFALLGLQLAAIVWHLHDVPITKPVGHMEDCCLWESQYLELETEVLERISTRNDNRIPILHIHYNHEYHK